MVIPLFPIGRDTTNGAPTRLAAGIAAVCALSLGMCAGVSFSDPDRETAAEVSQVAAAAEGDPGAQQTTSARGDAALRRLIRHGDDPPDPAQAALEQHLEARSPGVVWTITPLPFVVDRWSFFEVTPEGGDDVDTERFAVDATSGVVAAGDLAVLGEILHTLDILGSGTTEPFHLARIAGCVAGSRSTVLGQELLEGIPRPGELRPPSLTKADGAAQLVYYEQRVARGRLHSRCQVDIAADYAVTFTCTQYRR